MSSPWLDTLLRWGPSTLCIASATYNLTQMRKWHPRAMRAYAYHEALAPTAFALARISMALPSPAYIAGLRDDECRQYLELVGELAAEGNMQSAELYAKIKPPRTVRKAKTRGRPAGPIGPEDDPSWSK